MALLGFDGSMQFVLYVSFNIYVYIYDSVCPKYMLYLFLDYGATDYIDILFIECWVTILLVINIAYYPGVQCMFL